MKSIPPKLAMSLAGAVLILFAIQSIGTAPAVADVFVYHDFTYDHLVFAPPAAERCGESGVVTLAIAVDEDGRVSDAHLVKSSGYADLDVTAKQSAMGWRYRTAGAGANAFPHEVQAVFQPGGHAALHEGECSQASIDARAKAMEAAPLVIPARMPLGMEPPKLVGIVTSEVDLGETRSVACGPMAFTHMYTVIIGADGSVTGIDPSEQWGVAALDQAAARFVKSLRFDPARSNGHDVQVSISVWVTPRPQGATTCVLRAM